MTTSFHVIDSPMYRVSRAQRLAYQKEQLLKQMKHLEWKLADTQRELDEANLDEAALVKEYERDDDDDEGDAEQPT